MLALKAIALLLGIAHAQTWSCVLPNGTACQPGTANCACSQVVEPQATPVCPIGTFWSGVACEAAVQVRPPVYVNPHFWHQH